ncbi:MAG: hypothetical protein KDA69_09250 [Planctomycetaceae bacterium]|nr:hypothetical protein [Planctomycetaceae bacterium]MCA9044495.1 hypothetical protein [Planctomycetaceae bacterium]MCB9953326.1 hypothetical protein [Planctomycetaceae bacterium]
MFMILAQTADTQAALVGVLLGFLILGSIRVLLGTFTLRAACGLLNRISPNSVPEPKFGSAFGIALVRFLLNVALGFGIGLARGIQAEGEPQQLMVGLFLILAAIGFMIGTAIISRMLPTNTRRALLVALLEMAIVVPIAIILMLIYFAASAIATHGFYESLDRLVM